MGNFDKKEHWENIYNTKEFEKVSWYQKKPETSLSYLKKIETKSSVKIIDIGGGDSFFVDHLLEMGYEDVTVLDISKTALERAKKRLGEKADQVKWIVADAAQFEPTEQYDFWHDRAAFHFLSSEKDINGYLEGLDKSLKESGVAIIGTFSDNGPTKCSGIAIQQYSEITLARRLAPNFEKIACQKLNHATPFGGIQEFLFCSFERV